jgi:hypothetical protein
MPINEELKKIKNTGSELGNSVREKTVGYITAAFGLIAGLAWNDAIKSLIDSLIPTGGGSVIAKFLYAAFITAVIIIITRALVKTTSKN